MKTLNHSFQNCKLFQNQLNHYHLCTVYSFGNCDSRASFPLCNLLDIFAPWPRKMGAEVDLTSFTRYVDGWLRLLCIRYIWPRWPRQQYDTSHIYMAGVILLSRSTRPCEWMHGNAWTFLEQVIANIIFNNRCGMSDVAFRTAPPICGLSGCNPRLKGSEEIRPKAVGGGIFELR